MNLHLHDTRLFKVSLLVFPSLPACPFVHSMSKTLSFLYLSMSCRVDSAYGSVSVRHSRTPVRQSVSSYEDEQRRPVIVGRAHIVAASIPPPPPPPHGYGDESSAYSCDDASQFARSFSRQIDQFKTLFRSWHAFEELYGFFWKFGGKTTDSSSSLYWKWQTSG